MLRFIHKITKHIDRSRVKFKLTLRQVAFAPAADRQRHKIDADNSGTNGNERELSQPNIASNCPTTFAKLPANNIATLQGRKEICISSVL